MKLKVPLLSGGRNERGWQFLPDLCKPRCLEETTVARGLRRAMPQSWFCFWFTLVFDASHLLHLSSRELNVCSFGLNELLCAAMWQ